MAAKQSVSQLIHQVKGLLEGEFRAVNVEGEISNLSPSSAGHWYFTLADPDSTLSCALFKMDAMRNPLVRGLKNGDKVICSGEISVYAKRGTFQLITRRLVPAGAGDMKEQFERLKRKLAAEGLFDQDRKRPLPKFPRKIAIITAPQGAALQDFLNIFSRRAIMGDVLIIPSLVQGDAAPASLCKALQLAIAYHAEAACEGKGLEAIVLARGGGSAEDLWAFNAEALARAVAECPIPTISAVGHQVDFSICDFVADFRAETPSAAAEVLTNEQARLAERSKNLSRRLSSCAYTLVAEGRSRLMRANPHKMLGALMAPLADGRRRLARLDLRPRLRELTRVHEGQMRLDEALGRLSFHMSHALPERRAKLVKLHEMLRVLDPGHVLGRGYSYVKGADGSLLSSAKAFALVENGAKLDIVFHDGEGRALKAPAQT